MTHKLSYLFGTMDPLLNVFSAFPRDAGYGVDLTERHSAPFRCSHLMRLWILNDAAIVEGLCPVSLRDRHIQDSDLPPPGQPRLFSLPLFPSPLAPGTQL